MRTLSLSITLLIAATLSAQSLTDGIRYHAESGVIWSGGHDNAPFWLTSNQYGLLSTSSSSGYLRAGVFRSAQADSTRQWRHAYGLDMAVAYNHTSSLIVQQAYYDISWKCMRLSIGSKERPSALKNPHLSSGGLTFGMNARPIPQIRFEVPEYLTIPGTRGWLHIKGHLGYGLYTDNGWQKDFVAPNQRYTLNAIHHSKAGFLKIGNEQKFPLYFEGALEMATQFGGTAYNVTWGRQETATEDFKLGHGIKDFFKAFIPLGGDPTDGEGYANASGNHLGSWHFSLTYQPSTWKVRAYYEHFFEDHSMMFLDYGWEDGLAGLEVTLPQNPFIHTFLYEFMNSKDQSGPVYHDHTPQIPDQVSAVDNYYNHTLYPGWQHWGMSQGSPFILSPIYNLDGSHRLHFTHNRVQAHHMGICGTPIPQLTYRLLFSHAKHWGTYATPLLDTREQSSALLELTYTPTRRASGWQLKGSVGYDHGTVLGNSLGGLFTISKCGILTR